MEIKIVKADELDAVMNLIKGCINRLNEEGIFQWDENYPDTDIFKDDISHSSLYMLKEDDVPVGIIVLNEEQPSEYTEINWSCTTGKVLVVHRLAVDAACQGKGYAGKLMGFAEVFAKQNGYGSIRLEAYSPNFRSVKLYEKLGYVRRGQFFFSFREFPYICYEKILI